MRRLTNILLLMTMAAVLNGCAWGLYEDKRLMDTISNDKALATSIKTALMKESFFDGCSVAVYSYYRKVYLVGRAPAAMRQRIISIAQSKKPRSVTPHWFEEAKGKGSDIAIATRLRSALIGAKGLSSTRIDTEVNEGRVVLLGVVGSHAEKAVAEKTARGVEGVVSVTSYLMLPQMARAGAGTQASAPEHKENAGGKGGVESRDL